MTADLVGLLVLSVTSLVSAMALWHAVVRYVGAARHADADVQMVAWCWVRSDAALLAAQLFLLVAMALQANIPAGSTAHQHVFALLRALTALSIASAAVVNYRDRRRLSRLP